jgi:hypothetical protein
LLNAARSAKGLSTPARAEAGLEQLETVVVDRRNEAERADADEFGRARAAAREIERMNAARNGRFLGGSEYAEAPRHADDGRRTLRKA